MGYSTLRAPRKKKHLTFVEVKPGVWEVRPEEAYAIGEIRWRSRRGYVFTSDHDMFYDAGCLREITTFIRRETRKRKHGILVYSSIHYAVTEVKTKTKVWSIISKWTKDVPSIDLGEVRWNPGWRRYILDPYSVEFDLEQLVKITTLIRKAMREWRGSK